jgi:hypothetical protein
MTTYKIDKPEKGTGLIEYFLKYLTIFIVIGFLVWALIIFIATSGTLPKSIYMISLYLSFGLSAALITYLVNQKINKNKQGSIYQIDFDDKKHNIALHLFNEFRGNEFLVNIPYSNLKTEEKKQKIDIKAEQKIKIYNNTKLINVFNIPKTPWTVHPSIVLIVETFRKVKKD